MKNKFIKILLAGAISTGVLMSSTEVFAMNTNNIGKLNNDKSMVLLAKNDSIQNGKYNVGIQTLKEKSQELSMAGQYIDSNAVLDVQGGNMYLTVKILRNDWMKNIRVLVDDSEVDYEHAKQDSEGKVATLRFAISNKKPNIKFRMNVVPMGNADVAFRVVLNDNITKISGGSSDSDAQKNDSTKDNNGKELPQTGSPISGANLLTIGGLSTILGAGLLKKRK